MNLLNHDQGYFIWEVVIFFIFVVLLKRAAWKPLTSYLNERNKIISDSLASTEKIKMGVYQFKKENEMLRAKTENEITAIQNETRRYTENMLLEAENKAKASYDLIIEDAMSYIQKLKFDAINDIKSKTGILIVEIADKVLRKELSETPEQEELIKRLIDKVELKKEKS
jgi:F-type H+-transporting ATPase subunit b